MKFSRLIGVVLTIFLVTQMCIPMNVLAAVSKPTVQSSGATSVSQNSAMLNGTVSANGGGAITDYGHLWGTSSNPTTQRSVGSSISTPRSYTSVIAGLEAGKTYYYKAYATNSVGTNYGSILSFTTDSVVGISAPIITYPSNEQSIANGDILIKWNSVQGANYYLIAVRDETTNTKIVDNERTTSTRYTLSASKLTEGHRYKIAIGAYANESEYRWNDPLTYFSYSSVKPYLAVTETRPANNATNVDVDGDITLVFSNVIRKSSNSVKVVNTNNQQEVYIIATIEGNKLTLARGDNSKWSNNTLYSVTIPKEALVDPDGNPLANDYSFNFKTTETIIPVKKEVLVSAQIPSIIMAELAKSNNLLKGTISALEGDTITKVKIEIYKDSGVKLKELEFSPNSKTFDLSQVVIDATKAPFNEPGISPYKSRDYRFNISVSVNGLDLTRINEKNYILRMVCPYKISDTSEKGAAGLNFQESIQPKLIKNIAGIWKDVSTVTWSVDDTNVAAISNNTLRKVSAGDTILRANVNGVEVDRITIHVNRQWQPVVTFSEFKLSGNDLMTKISIINKGNTAPLKNVRYKWELLLDGKKVKSADWTILKPSIEPNIKLEQEITFKDLISSQKGVMEFRFHLICDGVKEVVISEDIESNNLSYNSGLDKKLAEEIGQKIKDNYQSIVRNSIKVTVNDKTYSILTLNLDNTQRILGKSFANNAWIFIDENGNLVEDPAIITSLQTIRYANTLFNSTKNQNWEKSISERIVSQAKLAQGWRFWKNFNDVVQTLDADFILFVSGVGLAKIAPVSAKQLLESTVGQITDVNNMLGAYIWWLIKLNEGVALKAGWYHGYSHISNLKDANRFINYVYTGFQITPYLILYQQLLGIPESYTLADYFKEVGAKVIDTGLEVGLPGSKDIKQLDATFNTVEEIAAFKKSIQNAEDILSRLQDFEAVKDCLIQVKNNNDGLRRALNPDNKESANFELLKSQ